MLNAIPSAVANGATLSAKIQVCNGFVLARAVHAVLYGGPVPTQVELDNGAVMPQATLLLASGAHIPTGRPFDEVAQEVEAANDEARYMRQAMEHIMAGVQVMEVQTPRGPDPDFGEVVPVAGDKPS